MSGEVARVERGSAITGIEDALTPGQLIAQIALIQNVMSSVMKEGEHYGKIPGCGDKPTLLKAGAEKLAFLFRHRPEFDVEIVEALHSIPGHREYRVKCRLFHINSGLPVGEGVGAASTLESKWRFRTGPTEMTTNAVPKEYWDPRKTDPKKAQELLGGRGFVPKKGDDKQWYIAVQGEKVENENPADVYNTVLKVAKKRAHVDAELTATAASDIFTQDVEELVENGVVQPAQEAGKPSVNPPQEKKPEGAAGTAEEIISQGQGKMLFAKFKGKGVKDSEAMNFNIRLWFGIPTLELFKLPKRLFEECNKKIDAMTTAREPGQDDDADAV